MNPCIDMDCRMAASTSSRIILHQVGMLSRSAYFRKEPNMRNKSIQLNIRISKAEYEKLMSSVEKSQLSTSSYIRSLIDGKAPKECPPLEYHELIQEMQGISTRLASIFHLVKITRCFDGTNAALLEKEMTQYRQILLAIQAAVLLPDKAV